MIPIYVAISLMNEVKLAAQDLTKTIVDQSLS